jgi:SAM-dependent methyltransferase
VTEGIELTGDALAQRLAETKADYERDLGSAAAHIVKFKQERLYKATHATWEGFCRDYLKMSARRADQIIAAAEIGTIVPILDAPAPVNEGQARALAPLKDDPEAMADVMAQVTEAAEAAGSKVTAQQIKDAVAARTQEEGETVVEVDGEGIVLPDPDLVPTPEVPPIVKPDLGDGVSHPARYSAAILERFEQVINQVCNVAAPTVRVLDPFAGTGKIHELPFDTTGVELEPEWGKLVPEGNIIGDAADMPFDDATFDVVATSPTYGNRLADHHAAADPHLRRSYTHDLGRRLTEGNTGELAWGPKYEEAHRIIWAEVRRVLKPGGWFLLNIKDHIRNGEQQAVSHWHTAALVELGFTFWPGYSGGVATQHLRQGAASERAGQELVLVFRRGND